MCLPNIIRGCSSVLGVMLFSHRQFEDLDVLFGAPRFWDDALFARAV